MLKKTRLFIPEDPLNFNLDNLLTYEATVSSVKSNKVVDDLLHSQVSELENGENILFDTNTSFPSVRLQVWLREMQKQGMFFNKVRTASKATVLVAKSVDIASIYKFITENRTTDVKVAAIKVKTELPEGWDYIEAVHVSDSLAYSCLTNSEAYTIPNFDVYRNSKFSLDNDDLVLVTISNKLSNPESLKKIEEYLMAFTYVESVKFYSLCIYDTYNIQGTRLNYVSEVASRFFEIATSSKFNLKLIDTKKFAELSRPDKVLSTKDYEDLHRLLSSKSDDNVSFAIKLLTECNYENSEFYLRLLHAEFYRRKIRYSEEYNSINSKLLRKFIQNNDFDEESFSFTNIIKILSRIKNRGKISQADMGLFYSLADKALNDQFNLMLNDLRRDDDFSNIVDYINIDPNLSFSKNYFKEKVTYSL